jgi:hypothetical protein
VICNEVDRIAGGSRRQDLAEIIAPGRVFSSWALSAAASESSWCLRPARVHGVGDHFSLGSSVGIVPVSTIPMDQLALHRPRDSSR